MYIKARDFQTPFEAITEAINEEAYTGISNPGRWDERNITCVRCGIEGHFKNQCYAEIDIQGRPRIYGKRELNRNNNFTWPNINGTTY